MVVGGTECVDRTYVEAPDRESGTNGMVQPLGQSLELRQSESGHVGGDLKSWECRGGWTNDGSNQRELGGGAGSLTKRTAPRSIPTATGPSCLDTQAGNERATTLGSADGEFILHRVQQGFGIGVV